MLKFRRDNVVSDEDFDTLVEQVYGRPYCFQQQDGCRERGVYYFEVPCSYAEECDYENDSIAEKVNAEERGVSFKAWFDRSPTQELDTEDEWERKNGLELFWTRSFYPAAEMVYQDLYLKGLIPAGEYQIVIDW